MKILKFILSLWAVIALTALSANAGSIRGTVTVKGLRSPENILVYLTKAPSTDTDFGGAKFVMDQQNLTFRPQILPIPVGATVLFPNNDKVDHNVFSLSRTQKFNLGSYKPGDSKTVTFVKAGVVELRCDVHAEMLAYILVMKSPYFAITDKDGAFEIPDSRFMESHNLASLPDLPAGSYTLKTRHAKLKTQKTTLTVPEQGIAEVGLDLTRGRPGALYKR